MLTSLLPLGEIEPMALPGVKCDLALTPGLLKNVFNPVSQGGVILLPNLSVLEGPQNAGYVDLDSNGYWWKPSDRISYAKDPSARPTLEVSEGRMNFFIPKCFTTPFGDVQCLVPSHV